MSELLQIVEQLVRVETRVWNRLDAALSQGGGVSLAQLVALRVLESRPGGRVQDLAEDIDISPGGASKLVDRLVAAGLVERSVDPADRRASLLAVTVAGREAVRDGSAMCEAWLRDRLADDLRGLTSALDTITARLANNMGVR